MVGLFSFPGKIRFYTGSKSEGIERKIERVEPDQSRESETTKATCAQLISRT